MEVLEGLADLGSWKWLFLVIWGLDRYCKVGGWFGDFRRDLVSWRDGEREGEGEGEGERRSNDRIDLATAIYICRMDRITYSGRRKLCVCVWWITKTALPLMRMGGSFLCRLGRASMF